MNFMNSFAEKHPKAAEWIRKGGLSIIGNALEVGADGAYLVTGGVAMVIIFAVDNKIFAPDFGKK